MYRRLLQTSVVLITLVTVAAAQSPTLRLASFLREVELPESYGVEIDSNKRVTIQLADLAGNRDFTGTMLRMTNSRNETQEIQVEADGVAILENVEPDFAAFSVTNQDLSNLVAFAAFTVESEQADPTVIPVITDSREVFVSTMRRDLDLSSDTEDEPFVVSKFADYGRKASPYDRVRLGANGALTGSVVMPNSDNTSLVPTSAMNVTLIQNGRVAARTTTGETGDFEIADLQPGIYGVIASGSAGFSAFSFQLDPAPEAGVTAVSMRNNQGGNASNSLIILIIPQHMLDSALEPIEDSYSNYRSVSGGASGTGGTGGGGGGGAGAPGGSSGPSGLTSTGSGGGGGGGGGGGIGAVGALGGLAAGLAGASGSSGSSVASPATP